MTGAKQASSSLAEQRWSTPPVGRGDAGHQRADEANLRPTLAEEAYEELKRRILMIELEPGSQFREADVAASLGLGKTPVREAVLRLGLEGLVRVQSRSGYTVAPVTLKSARDVCELRALLEGEAAERAASARGGATEALGAIVAGPRALPRGEPAELARDREALTGWLRAERAFHLALARASGNDLLAATLGSLLEGFARVCYLAAALGWPWPLAVHDHASLLEAITSGRPAEARSLVVGEVRSAEGHLIAALLGSESLSTTNVDATPAARKHTFYLNVPTDPDEGAHNRP